MQNALLGKITSNMKEIELNYSERSIYVHFYFEGKISEEDKQNMKEIMNDFISFYSSY